MRVRFWPKQRWLRGLIILLLVFLLVYSAENGTRPRHEKPSLRIACFNIAHGRGLAESNSEGGTAEERLARLNRIAKLLLEIDADVVVLNEVDFDTHWSDSVNQARYLADRAGYRYRAEQRHAVQSLY